MQKRTTLALLVAMTATLGASAAQAADEPAASYPSKQGRVIVSFAPGGSSDVVGRFIAQKLGEKFGQTYIVENRAGAAGNVGTDAVAKSQPDGYTLGMSTSGPLANNKFLYKNMPFDPEKNLTPIALVCEIPLIIAANPGIGASNLKELISVAKSKPGALSIASPGNGTIGHLALELLKTTAKIDMVHVPYKGDTPAMTDVIAGSVQVLSVPITSVIPHVQSGKLKGLAVTSKQRFPGLPDMPTAIEQGVNIEATVWNAMVGPAGVPKPIVDKLNAEINRIVASEEGKAKIAQFGAVPGGGPADRLGALMRTEAAKWKQVIETANVKVE